MRVYISIPAYNEEKTLGSVIRDIHSVMKKTKHPYMIAVVNDGSKDNTASVAKQAGAHVIDHPQNFGLAQAFRTEI